MDTIPGFDIQGLIYEGPDFAVFKACRTLDNKTVNLKVPKSGNSSTTILNSFRQEFSICSTLDSKSIQKAHDLQVENSFPVLVLDNFDGNTLKSHSVDRKIQIDEMLSVALKIVKALEDIHSQDIIHRNINPLSILYNNKSGLLKLTDFRIASRLQQEIPAVVTPNIHGSLLPYISPEQSGRMNRLIDFRTDFYSFGITLFELLVGNPPFISHEPLELIHCHMAVEPKPPREIAHHIPKPISDIIMKLLSKNAEDRYQSTYGLKEDLKKCLRQWDDKSEITHFSLGTKDISGRFQIPQKLYGRDDQIAVLMEGFSRVNMGNSELMLVTGPAGIGKSALIRELYKPITRAKGYFVGGKFDQLQRNRPYSAFFEAFGELCRQLLTEPESQISLWKSRLLETLEDDGQIIIDVIPEVELVIGQQKTVPDLPVKESQQRFNAIFKKFIQVFAQKSNPVTVFLDDLQWADMASLSLIKTIIGNPDSTWLYLLGAYRDNEVSSSHPLSIVLEEMIESGASVQTLTLKPLNKENVRCLMVDTLKSQTDRVSPLANIVFSKTKGNPYFLNEFLKNLFEEGLLNFNRQEGKWIWNLDEISEKEITGNVVDLLVDNIRKLSEETQSLLKIASCIGNRFYLDTIIQVSGDSPALIQHAFGEALREGLLILRGSQTFLIDDKVRQYSRNALKEAVGNNNIEPIVAEFVHDRVQQAAYSIISEDERTETHIKLGRQMLSHCTREQIEDNLFDIVDQFNRGLRLLSEDDEKQRLVQLNLRAGKKAAESAAYKNAVSYFDAAIDVLDPDSWNSDHVLTWDLYYRKAECEFSSALLEECEETVKNTLIRCKTIDEQVVFYQIQLKLLFQATRHFEAIEVIREVLEMLGVRLPRTIKKRHIAWEFIKFNIALGGRKPWELLDQPEIEDRHQLNICAVIYDSIPSTYMVNPDIMGYLSLIMANICLRFGNSIYAPFAFAMIPVVMVGVTKQYQTAYDYSMMAIKLNEKFPSLDVKARIYFLAGFFSLHWVKPIRDHIPLWQTAYQCTLEAGNLHWHNYCVTFTRLQSVLFNNQGLDDIEAVNKDFYDMHRRSKDREVSLNQLFVLKFVESLRKTENDRQQSPYDFDEQKYAAEMALPGNYLIRAYYYGFNLVRDFVFEDYRNAQKNGVHAMCVVHEVLGNLSEFVIRFFYLLTLLRVGQKLSLWQRFKLIGPYWKNKILLWHSARNCPENFLPQYTLLLAEEARVRVNHANAPILYEKAIQLARKSDFPLFTALCNELAAKYYQERGVVTIATGYINEALNDYASWGALAKTEALKKRYPDIFKSTTDKGETDSSSMDALDLTSAIKASRAISSEIKLTSLLNRLMQIIIENVGAQRGLLVIVTEDEMKIEAVADVQSDELNILQSIPVVDSTHLPVTLVRYVKRTRENVVLGSAGSDVNYINDPYIANHKPKSIICTPISYQDKVSGILYLENNSAASAFTQEHIDMLSILLPQMAISLENAKLFEETKQAQIALGNSNRDLYKTKQYLESLINNANVWLNVLDTEGNVVIWNKAAEKISGFTSDEVLGNNNIWEWAYPDERYRNEIQAKANEIINRGEAIENFETTIKRKDQETRVISWHSRNLSDETGNPVGSIAIGRDVTKTKFLEEQLAQAHKMEAVGTLASGIFLIFSTSKLSSTGFCSVVALRLNRSSC